MTTHSIENFAFDQDSFTSNCELFPEAISNNNWIAYHGSCLLYSDDIETNGLRVNYDIFELESIQNLLNIWNRINVNAEVPGRKILQNHVENHHSILNRIKPISFYSVSSGSIRYASPTYYGGQVVSAVREAFEFIDDYINSNLSDPNNISIQTLLNEPEIKLMRETLNRFIDASTNRGVIYAIQFDVNDLRWVERSLLNAIYSYQNIPVRKIIGKVTLPANIIIPNNINDIYNLRCNRLLENRNSLIGSLLRAELTNH